MPDFTQIDKNLDDKQRENIIKDMHSILEKMGMDISEINENDQKEMKSKNNLGSKFEELIDSNKSVVDAITKSLPNKFQKIIDSEYENSMKGKRKELKKQQRNQIQREHEKQVKEKRTEREVERADKKRDSEKSRRHRELVDAIVENITLLRKDVLWSGKKNRTIFPKMRKLDRGRGLIGNAGTILLNATKLAAFGAITAKNTGLLDALGPKVGGFAADKFGYSRTAEKIRKEEAKKPKGAGSVFWEELQTKVPLLGNLFGGGKIQLPSEIEAEEKARRNTPEENLQFIRENIESINKLLGGDKITDGTLSEKFEKSIGGGFKILADQRDKEFEEAMDAAEEARNDEKIEAKITERETDQLEKEKMAVAEEGNQIQREILENMKLMAKGTGGAMSAKARRKQYSEDDRGLFSLLDGLGAGALMRLGARLAPIIGTVALAALVGGGAYMLTKAFLEDTEYGKKVSKELELLFHGKTLKEGEKTKEQKKATALARKEGQEEVERVDKLPFSEEERSVLRQEARVKNLIISDLEDAGQFDPKDRNKNLNKSLDSLMRTYKKQVQVSKLPGMSTKPFLIIGKGRKDMGSVSEERFESLMKAAGKVHFQKKDLREKNKALDDHLTRSAEALALAPHEEFMLQQEQLLRATGFSDKQVQEYFKSKKFRAILAERARAQNITEAMMLDIDPRKSRLQNNPLLKKSEVKTKQIISRQDMITRQKAAETQKKMDEEFQESIKQLGPEYMEIFIEQQKMTNKKLEEATEAIKESKDSKIINRPITPLKPKKDTFK
jgi:hypothetical protein